MVDGATTGVRKEQVAFTTHTTCCTTEIFMDPHPVERSRSTRGFLQLSTKGLSHNTPHFYRLFRRMVWGLRQSGTRNPVLSLGSQGKNRLLSPDHAYCLDTGPSCSMIEGLSLSG